MIIDKGFFENPSIELYYDNIDAFGLNTVWDDILEFSLKNNQSENILNVNNFGKLYELGLAYVDKANKKELGKYYTPKDVSILLSKWFDNLFGDNICDVCCGTGNLILGYFEYVGVAKTIGLLKNKKIHLYDIDSLALKICKYSICILYGIEYINNINCHNVDFLSESVILPKDSKVISNPPYFKITEINDDWEKTDVLMKTKEFYSTIMEKIIKQSTSSVIITPYSFVDGNKFYSLRLLLNKHNGYIFSFDSVPGNIFNETKNGTSIRTAITVTKNDYNIYGYRVTPLIRFNNTERKKLFDINLLESLLTDEYQIVNEKSKMYYKCFPSCEPLFKSWKKYSDETFDDIISKQKTEYHLCVPNSCRYFTLATVKILNRFGKNIFYFKDRDTRDLMYCMLNSSFMYWHWRLYDGGITYSVGLLKSLPIFFNLLTKCDKDLLIEYAKEMQKNEEKYLVYKKNASEMQESVKFPKIYREKINDVLCRALGFENNGIFDIVHSNVFFLSDENTN